MRTFEEINATIAEITGVPVTNAGGRLGLRRLHPAVADGRGDRRLPALTPDGDCATRVDLL